MYGIVKPAGVDESEPVTSGWVGSVRRTLRVNAWFISLVILPTAIAAFYLYLFAADQYEAEADFVIRRADAPAVTNNVGQILGMNLGSSATTSESHLVGEYLQSHETVARLRKEDALVAKFRRDRIDWYSRLWYADPTPEQLLKYFRSQVDIVQDTDTGISHMTVHACTPEDAYEIGRKMLLLGEERINQLNERTYRDQVQHSARELRAAEEDLALAETRMTNFRRQADDIDPSRSGSAQIGLVAELTGSLTTARARLQAMRGAISQNSPQYRAMEMQVRALETQVAGQSERIAGGTTSIASKLGDFENLIVRREAAAKRYGAAAAAFENAKAEAERKQVYLVRVVDVNKPVKSLFPERGKIVLIVFVALTFFYAIGWMIVAGLREHHL